MAKRKKILEKSLSFKIYFEYGQKDMSERYMPSIFSECDTLKQAYDKCFTIFFQQYISPEYRHLAASNPCKKLHLDYRECVERNLAKHRPYEIDLEELRKEKIDNENFLRSNSNQT